MFERVKLKIHNHIQQQTIDVRLMIFISIIICMIFFVFSGLYIKYERDRTIMESERLLQQSLQMQIRFIEDWYRDRASDVARVSQLHSLRTQNLDNILQDFEANFKNSKDVTGYVFVDKLGATIVDPIVLSGRDVKNSEYYRRGMQGEEFITDIIVARVTGQKTVIFSEPVLSYENHVIGVVFANIAIRSLQSIVQNFEFGTTGIVYLLDSRGNLIAQSSTMAENEEMQDSEGFSKAIAGFSGVDIYTNQNGHRVVGAYQWIPERQWTILCEVDEEEILQPFYEQLIRYSILSSLILFLALYLTWLIAKNIQKPILILVEVSERTQRGDYLQTIQEDQFQFAPVEIRQLCNAFNIMMGTTNEHMIRLYDTNKSLAIAEKKYRLLSTQDPLTQIYNRTYFEIECERLQMLQQIPICVVGLDVDGLKLVNDTLGHKAGDGLIRAAAENIKKSFRDQDIVARVGGDEFIVLMPGAEFDEMQAGMKRLKAAIVVHNKVHPELPLVISMGGAIATQSPLQLEELISEADNNMYQEKHANRNSNRSVLLSTLMQAASERDAYYSEHIEGVKKWALQIGKALQMNDDNLQRLELTAQYHDIGKVGITKEILHKPEKLSDEDWVQVRQHSELGGRIANAVPEINSVADFITAHHEKWDGSGYPNHLKGEFIPLISRIITIADAYDAMRRDRVYRSGKTVEEARQELLQGAGKQFDPTLVEIFLAIQGGR